MENRDQAYEKTSENTLLRPPGKGGTADETGYYKWMLYGICDREGSRDWLGS